MAVVPSVVNVVSTDGQGKSDDPPTRGNERFNVKLMAISSSKVELNFFYLMSEVPSRLLSITCNALSNSLICLNVWKRLAKLLFFKCECIHFTT